MRRPHHGGNLTWAAKFAGCPVSALVDFSASINPLGPPESAITAIQQGLSSLTHYPDPDYYQLRSILGQWHQLHPDWILPGNGSAELLTWASWDLSIQELTFLITPAFGDYWRALKTFSTRVQPCPLDLTLTTWKLELNSALAEPIGKRALDLKSVGLLLNNPHNPTGKLWTREEILPYVERFGLVVVDEAFMDFIPPQQQQSLISVIEDYPNLIILRSLTKFYSLPGLRLGYAIAHPQRLQRWQQWRDPWPVNLLAQQAAVAIIEDHTFQQLTWDWLPATRAKLFEGLAALPTLLPLPGAANFLLVHTNQSSSQLQEKLLKNHHIVIRDCISFPELGDRFFRVAVRTQTDNQRLVDALAKLVLSP
ncbi:threonine-phosphate decarboxylase CobD [Gloeothece verrucosa]|uniref:threonine-phosphate decarboxylase n=1 Tax=Gloeothece verrucosa (strain PCC 7822) TaxID=497965 RepID=E0UER9_GLOV7|nr:threonine-phosphate decarboxylase CobD [Gloeothece verrucosa]ADN13049.1 L-threonine-O-3-phosphate decarboxylase [Gloeothece verrucosa PCC 7822]